VLFTVSFGYGHFIETLLLQKTQPLIAILLASLWLRERLSAAAWALVPVALFGAYLIAVPEPFQPWLAWNDFHIVAALYGRVFAVDIRFLDAEQRVKALAKAK